jgi:hypothetical protein
MRKIAPSLLAMCTIRQNVSALPGQYRIHRGQHGAKLALIGPHRLHQLEPWQRETPLNIGKGWSLELRWWVATEWKHSQSIDVTPMKSGIGDGGATRLDGQLTLGLSRIASDPRVSDARHGDFAVHQ